MSKTVQISRRDFFRLRFLRDRVENAALQSPSMDGSKASLHRKPVPIHRPPGAIAEETFLNGCTKCNECAVACPHDAIIPAPDRFGRAAGTPMIDVNNSPCHMCKDMPCIAACDEEALRADLPVKMGEARINRMNCLAYQGSFCSTCSERCPVEGAITTELGKPTINADVCTGCGICAHVCPAPVNAVLVMPEKDRPTDLNKMVAVNE